MGALIEVNFDTNGLAKLADTIGGWLGFNAKAIEQMADAEAYAKFTNAEAENAVALLKQQGEYQLAKYICAKESRKLNNVRNVIEKTQTQFGDDEQVSNEPVNPDWTNRFFSIVEDISDEEMQKLWAQILAGEIKHPKSYSLRTLEALKNMTKEDAELLLKISPYVFADNIYIEGDYDSIIQATDEIKLEDIGILCTQALTWSVIINAHDHSGIKINQHQYMEMYNVNNSTIKLHLSIRRLRTAGIELIKLIANRNSTNLIQNLANKFKTQGCSKVTISPITKHLNDNEFYYDSSKAINI